MTRRYLTIISVLGMMFNNAPILNAQEIKGQGKYRPLTLIRHIRLGTSVLGDPDLIDKVQIFNAYSFEKASQLLSREELLERVRNGKLRLAVRLGEQVTLTLLPADVALDPDATNLEQIYVLSLHDLNSDTEDRVITWDPAEPVQLPGGLEVLEGAGWDPGSRAR